MSPIGLCKNSPESLVFIGFYDYIYTRGKEARNMDPIQPVEGIPQTTSVPPAPVQPQPVNTEPVPVNTVQTTPPPAPPADNVSGNVVDIVA
jgi:hypothetical protein